MDVLKIQSELNQLKEDTATLHRWVKSLTTQLTKSSDNKALEKKTRVLPTWVLLSTTALIFLAIGYYIRGRFNIFRK
jgi:hypothetical protein